MLSRLLWGARLSLAIGDGATGLAVAVGIAAAAALLGAMPADGRRFLLQGWWIATFPGLAIFLVVLGFDLLGDGLREALDPRFNAPRRRRGGVAA